MSEEGKVEAETKQEPTEQKEDAEVVEDSKIPGEPGEEPAILPKDGEIVKDEDILNDQGDADYRRKSFHAKPYTSPTIVQTQKDVDELIVKRTRYHRRWIW